VRQVDDHVDAFGIEPLARQRGRDVRLGPMVGADDGDRLAQHLAAEFLDRHLGRHHRALAGQVRRAAGHVGHDADLDAGFGPDCDVLYAEQRCDNDRHD
jgi:hypothetical protein